MSEVAVKNHRVEAAESTLQSIGVWIRVWSPAVPLRWLRRHRFIAALSAFGLMGLWVCAAHALADDPGTGAGPLGSALSSWTDIRDSEGVEVSKYTLTLNQGGWSSPAVAAISWIDSAMYEFYVFIIATGLWIIKFALGFQWMDIFARPFKVIGDGIITAMDKFGLMAMSLAALAVIVAITFLAQKTAKAFSQVAMGLLMAGVATTIFAHPLADLVGPNGLLSQGRDTGLEMATVVSGGTLSASNTSGANIDPMISSLADRFLRKPTQLMNFGQVSDSISRKCQEAWSDGVNKGRGDKLKDDMKACDATQGDSLHKKAMDKGNAGSILAAMPIFFFLGAFLVAFAFYFAWHVVRAAVQAMFYAVLAPPAFVVGVIPGGAQTFAWKTVLDCAMAYLAMILFTAGFGAYNVILDNAFNTVGLKSPVAAMVLAAIVLAFGFAFFGPLRRLFDHQRDALAARLGRGGGGSGGMPGANAAQKAGQAVQDAAQRRWANRVDDAPPTEPESGSGVADEKPADKVDDKAPAEEGPGLSWSSAKGADSTAEGASAATSGTKAAAESSGTASAAGSAASAGGGRNLQELHLALKAAVEMKRKAAGSEASEAPPRNALSESAV